jgi:hypothetical protein
MPDLQKCGIGQSPFEGLHSLIYQLYHYHGIDPFHVTRRAFHEAVSEPRCLRKRYVDQVILPSNPGEFELTRITSAMSTSRTRVVLMVHTEIDYTILFSVLCSINSPYGLVKFA